eukprot:TRINITY_DN4827_c0_g1_i1.p2 TRINITY_DN4827_c0_g1~~TRINITY_DN4827_c0_g1_i1.p2  ORF type:complete len:539 (+),score=159.84 TRINITY_DN4827_c0_g1_i1:91-1617(+)
MGPWYVAAVDQGTTSSRVVIYDHTLHTVASHQVAHEQKAPNPGWLQHNPIEILLNVEKCINTARSQLMQRDPEAVVRAIGITNQRETVVIWDRETGEPLYDAVVWCDLRTQETVDATVAAHGGNKDCFRARTGLPCSPYFSAYKMKWLRENVPSVREALAAGTALIGTIESWLTWNLTGRACHVTSICNASRTSLMDLRKGQWDPDLCREFGIPVSALPRIVSNAEVFAPLHRTSMAGVPLAALIGDQHAALVGQMGFKPGDVKNTYGTGCFLVMNTGTEPRESTHGLLSTVGYKIGNSPTVYALEGAVVQGGMLITWLKDNLGLISDPAETEKVASTVPDSGSVVIVPAFAGLFAPHWRADARGVICGLTMHSTKGHICRAALSAIAMQSCEVLWAMEKDSGLSLRRIRVDGGATKSGLLMQLQADLADLQVIVPLNAETTALGTAMCAAVGAGCLASLQAAEAAHTSAKGPDRVYRPQLDAAARAAETARWRKAVERSKGWVESKL